MAELFGDREACRFAPEGRDSAARQVVLCLDVIMAASRTDIASMVVLACVCLLHRQDPSSAAGIPLTDHCTPRGMVLSNSSTYERMKQYVVSPIRCYSNCYGQHHYCHCCGYNLRLAVLMLLLLRCFSFTSTHMSLLAVKCSAWQHWGRSTRCLCRRGRCRPTSPLGHCSSLAFASTHMSFLWMMFVGEVHE